MYLPRWVYEALPWFYVAVGYLGLYLTNGSAIALVFAFMLLAAAIVIQAMRHEFRMEQRQRIAAHEERDKLRRELRNFGVDVGELRQLDALSLPDSRNPGKR